MCRRILGVVFALLCGAATDVARAQSNFTPGDSMGLDFTAVRFSPYRWDDMHGGKGFRDHVGFHGGLPAGQRYSYIEFVERAPPTASVPTQCTVASLYNIIHNMEPSLAVLLITSHGTVGQIDVEVFEGGPAGRAAMDARFDAYINGTTGIPDLPKFTALEIIKQGSNSPSRPNVIAVWDVFFRNHGRLNQSLVYFGTCNGGSPDPIGSSMATAAVNGGARVAIGPPDQLSYTRLATDIGKFFKRLDGKEGLGMRNVAAARGGLFLSVAGEENTTLSPAVASVSAPCPLKAPQIVIFGLDTDCNTMITPDIVGTGVTIENEVWLNPRVIYGTCTAPPADAMPGACGFILRLRWPTVRSARNNARLDGNENPMGAGNAVGPSWDDYVQQFSCSCAPPTVAPSAADDPLVSHVAWEAVPIPRNDATVPRGAPIPNDDCIGAFPAPVGVPLCVMGSTAGAMADAVPSCPAAPTAPGVWFSVVGTGGQMTFTTCPAALPPGSCPPFTDMNEDAFISVYEGSCATLECVAFDDDTCGERADEDPLSMPFPEVSWCTEMGVTYYVLVHGFGSSVGEFSGMVIDAGPCMEVTGACCTETGCMYVTETACLEAKGAFLGQAGSCIEFFSALTCLRPKFADLNCDDAVDLLDLDPFALALISDSMYAGEFPGCDARYADLNFDEMMDAADLPHFIDILMSQ